MKTVTFFRAALVVPLVAPLLLLPFGLNVVAGVLLISLMFGGVQYALFAAVLFLAVGRLGSAERITRLSLWAPVLFVPVQAAGWLLYAQYGEPQGEWELSELLPGGFYSLLLGYVYVFVVNGAFYLFHSRGWVSEDQAA